MSGTIARAVPLAGSAAQNYGVELHSSCVFVSGRQLSQLRAQAVYGFIYNRFEGTCITAFELLDTMIYS
jgi:hypothetical protein